MTDRFVKAICEGEKHRIERQRLRIAWVQFEGPPKFFLRFAPFPFVKKAHHGRRKMGFSETLIKLQRLRRRLFHRCNSCFGGNQTEKPKAAP